MSIDYGRQIANAVDNAFSKGKTIATEAERELVGMNAYNMQTQINQTVGRVYDLVCKQMNTMLNEIVDSFEEMYNDEW